LIPGPAELAMALRVACGMLDGRPPITHTWNKSGNKPKYDIPEDLRRWVSKGRLINPSFYCGGKTRAMVQPHGVLMILDAVGHGICGMGQVKAIAILVNLRFVKKRWPAEWTILKPHLRAIQEFAKDPRWIK